jgi:long-chain acyl-CoA synthetase
VTTWKLGLSRFGEPEDSMSDLLEYLEAFRRRGAETAYAHRRGYRVWRWSYGEIAESACRFARELESRGVGKGHRVLVWGENCPEWVVAFYGCLLRGAVVVPMDLIAAPDFIRRVSHQTEPKLAVCSREVARQAPGIPSILLETLRETLERHSGAPYTPAVLAPEDPVEIVFTSGTTSEPKGVVISQANILANLHPLENEITRYLKWERFVHPLRFLNLLPLSHVFGQFLGIFVPQLLGGTVVFLDTLNPTEVISTIRRERISVLVAVPRLLESLRDRIQRDLERAGALEDFQRKFAAADGKHFARRWWRFRQIHSLFGWKFWAIVSGGAALDRKVEEFWGRLAFAVVQGYGLTETTSLVTVNHPFRLSKGSIGKPLAGREIKLAEDGEILVRGGNVTAGYWQGQGAQPVLASDGWFHTGDRGELGANGNLFFKGRAKNVIVTAEGMNIYPEDLEAALRRQPEVRDCVVVGLERGGNAEPCAALILAGEVRDAEAAVRRANQSLAGYQQIRRWLIWPDDDFPRGSTHKPKLRLIAEEVQARLGGRGEGVREAAQGTLAELIERATGRAGRKLSPGDNLEKDLNFSSLDRVELLSAIEDRYQIDLNESKFAAATTVGELEEMLRQPPAKRSDYSYPHWAQRWPITWIRLAVYYLLSWPATLLLGYPRVRGRDNLRGVRGPVLVVSNHVTYVDIGFILAAMPARFRHRLAVAMMGERLQGMRRPPPEAGFFKRIIDQMSYALVVALFNVFPLPQQTGFRESFAHAGQSVDGGYSVVVFPEGRRTLDGKLSPFRAGVGLLADRLGIPVVPVRIDGLFDLKKAGKKMARPGTVRVSIGSPTRFEPGAKPEAVAAELEKRVASLAWE